MYDRYEIYKNEDLYPKFLLDLEHPPELIYVQGSLECFQNLGMGVIGARKATPYGQAVSRLCGAVAAHMGITVVSGGASGCDYHASKSALETGGSSIIVAGCGADVVYPSASQDIFEQCWSGKGCVVSLVPWKTKPKRYLFPKRNPVIAALSKVLIVVEAAIQSGTMSTALAADTLGRTLYAIPGSIFSKYSAGTNKLIADGAALITDRESLETQLSLDFGELLMSAPRTYEQDSILQLLAASPSSLKEIADHLAITEREALILMGDYESNGLVQRCLDGRFSLTDCAYLNY